MEKWLDNVRRMAILDGLLDFHIGGTTLEILTYAYWANFSAIEAVSFFRLVRNEMGHDDPAAVQEVEMRAQDLTRIAKLGCEYNPGMMRHHVSRFIQSKTATGF
jgi:hypothetical protein